MAKGAVSKSLITDIILKTFPGSFLYNGGKELRIQCQENGEVVQIKCAFTCAKENVDGGSNAGISVNSDAAVKYVEPTEEELNEVAKLLKELGIESE